MQFCFFSTVIGISFLAKPDWYLKACMLLMPVLDPAPELAVELKTPVLVSSFDVFKGTFCEMKDRDFCPTMFAAGVLPSEC